VGRKIGGRKQANLAVLTWGSAEDANRRRGERGLRIKVNQRKGEPEGEDYELKGGRKGGRWASFLLHLEIRVRPHRGARRERGAVTGERLRAGSSQKGTKTEGFKEGGSRKSCALVKGLE